MTKRSGFTVAALALALVFALLFSVFFILTESHHDCVGEGCAICSGIRACESSLRFAGVAVAACFIFCPARTVRTRRAACPVRTGVHASLISLKVRLSE